MKLKNGYITYNTGDEQIMVSAGASAFHGMVRSNKTAAFIIDCLKEQITEAAIVEKMADAFEAPIEIIERDVKQVLSQLRSIGALDE